jgi:hypothetical protein
MNFMFSVFFGAGVAAWVYSKMGRRVGYGNAKNVWTLVGVIFVLTTIVFYTILVYVLQI